MRQNPHCKQVKKVNLIGSEQALTYLLKWLICRGKGYQFVRVPLGHNFWNFLQKKNSAAAVNEFFTIE